jgi:hypothetical protein
MISRSSLRIVLLFLSSAAAAQSFGLPGSASPTFSMPYRSLQSIDVNENLWLVNGQDHSPLESPNGSLSKLDLKAPGKARREYEKGYQLLMRKDHQGALEHLITATSIYPSFVAAHNALARPTSVWAKPSRLAPSSPRPSRSTIICPVLF